MRVRAWIVTAVVSAWFFETTTVLAQDPCTADLAQFCSDIPPGSGSVQRCLQRHEAQLSPGCRARRAAVERRIRDIVREFVRACEQDMERLCGDIKQGEGRILACMLRQQDDLTSRCHDQTERYEEAAQTIASVRAACKADVERMCGKNLPNAGSIVECVRANHGGLSEACRAIDPTAGMRAAELVDAVDAVKRDDEGRTVHQILQGIESIAFARSQVLFQFDNFQRLRRVVNANRFLLSPQVVFGRHSEFAVLLRAPVITAYRDAPVPFAQTGLGPMTTAISWGFMGTKLVRQFVSFALQEIVCAAARGCGLGGDPELRDLRPYRALACSQHTAHLVSHHRGGRWLS